MLRVPGADDSSSVPPEPPLRWLLGALGRNWILIVVVTLAAAGAAGALSYRQANEYRAEMGIVVGQGGGLLQPGFGQSPEPFTQTISGLLKSDIIAREVVVQSGLRVSPSELRRNLKVTTRPESTVLDIQYDSTNRALALQVLQGIARVFPKVLNDRFSSTGRGSRDERVSVTVFDPPRALADPVAPRPVRTAAIAGVLGLLLGCGLAVAGDVLSRSRKRSVPGLPA